MKKILAVLMTVALFYSCEKESSAIEDEVNLELQDKSLSETEVANKYFGVFLSNDLELHGEIHIDLNEGAKHAAFVRLLNGKELYFKASTDLSDAGLVQFKGASGSFSLDMTDIEKIQSSDFLVEDKEGHVKVYAQRPGIPPSILFGVYEDFAEPSFTGAWDILTFGAFEPTLGLPMIDEIIITHAPTGSLYSDETFGTLEPFVTPSCPSVPLPGGVPVIGGFTDGIIISAIDQVATFNGDPATWTVHGFAFEPPVDPAGCSPLPPGFNGAWVWSGRSGIITILTPPWAPI